MNVHGRWHDTASDGKVIGWCRSLWKYTEDFASGEAYVSFMTDDEGDRVQEAYGDRYQRLVEVKNRWDPGNLFRMNQNVAPTG